MLKKTVVAAERNLNVSERLNEVLEWVEMNGYHLLSSMENSKLHVW